jgi:hypothetical protein
VTIDVAASHGELIDVLERVLTRGVIVEIAGDAEGASAMDRDDSAWFRISIAGVDVLEVSAGGSWRYLFQTPK